MKHFLITITLTLLVGAASVSAQNPDDNSTLPAPPLSVEVGRHAVDVAIGYVEVAAGVYAEVIAWHGGGGVELEVAVFQGVVVGNGAVLGVAEDLVTILDALPQPDSSASTCNGPCAGAWRCVMQPNPLGVGWLPPAIIPVMAHDAPSLGAAVAQYHAKVAHLQSHGFIFLLPSACQQ